ncbi:MAG: hypothetical protein M3P93_13840 [Actinomycetota bacterium]|nr:hypothetical protein [Actinomycetota bacterium]
MRLRSQALALLGLSALAIVAVLLLTGALSVEEAATRIAVVLVVLLVAERVLLPVARSLVGPAKEPEPVAQEGVVEDGPASG